MSHLCNMTEGQQRFSIGMWCYVTEDNPWELTPTDEGIIIGYEGSGDEKIVNVFHPREGGAKIGHKLNEVMPRFDIPRAWNLNGSPHFE